MFSPPGTVPVKTPGAAEAGRFVGRMEELDRVLELAVAVGAPAVRCFAEASSNRAVSERTRSKVMDGVRRVAEGVAAAHGAEVTVGFLEGYPVTVNTPGSADFSIDVAKEVLGDDHVFRLPNPVMGAEDFSYVLNRIPGSMMFLGATPHDRDPFSAAPNHSNRVYFDEGTMVQGMAVYSAMAIRHLSGLPG